MASTYKSKEDTNKNPGKRKPDTSTATRQESPKYEAGRYQVAVIVSSCATSKYHTRCAGYSATYYTWYSMLHIAVAIHVDR